MEITQEKINDLNAKLYVKIAPEDYRDSVRKVINDYARKAKLKGFRPGKVPASVIRKMYGKGVVFEELNKIISEELNKYIDTEDLPLVGEPLPLNDDIDLDPEGNSDYEFVYEIGFAPEFSIDYGLAADAPRYKVTIDDEILEKEIESMQEKHGPMSNPEVSGEGDILYGKLVQLDDAGEVVEDGLEKMIALNPKRVPSEKVKAEMASGKKADDTFDVKTEDIFENDNATRRFWETNVQGEHIRDVEDDLLESIKGMTFRFEVRKINRIEKLEMGQELFDKVLGEGEVENEEDFRARITEDMEKFFAREAQRYFRSKAIRALIEGIEIPLPDEFLQKWLVRTREAVTDDNIAEMYVSYQRSLRWRLIVEKMQAEDENVKVNQDDIIARAKEMVKEQFGAMVGEDEEKLEQFASYFLNDNRQVERIFDELIEDRVFAHLEEKNPLPEEEVTATEFMEKLKAED